MELKAVNKIRILHSPSSRVLLDEISNKPWMVTSLVHRMFNINDVLSYIEIVDEETISYISLSKIKLLYKEHLQTNPNVKFDKFSKNYKNEDFWTKFRVHIKIGRFAKRLVDTYHETWGDYKRSMLNAGGSEMSDDRHVELFVNEFKAITKRILDKDFMTKISLVEGEEIKYWYDEKNYLNNKGGLGASCMRYSKCTKYLNIYTKNPERCKLLIFKEIPDKISIRALVWKLDNGSFYMDRIYSNKQSDIILFINYAKERGWISYDNSDINYDINLSLQLSEVKYSYFPYMDTFKYYTPETYRLHTQIQTNCYELGSQDGEYKLKNSTVEFSNKMNQRLQVQNQQVQESTHSQIHVTRTPISFVMS